MNPKVLQKLRDNRVYAVSLPSHTTAALQLLDVAVFGPIKKAFRAAVYEWRDLNPMEMLADRRDIPNLISMIWRKSCLPGRLSEEPPQLVCTHSIRIGQQRILGR